MDTEKNKVEVSPVHVLNGREMGMRDGAQKSLDAANDFLFNKEAHLQNRILAVKEAIKMVEGKDYRAEGYSRKLEEILECLVEKETLEKNIQNRSSELLSWTQNSPVVVEKLFAIVPEVKGVLESANDEKFLVAA